MGKMVGMAEFKANCTRLLRELSEDGEAITVTVRGKPVAVVRTPEPVTPPVLGSAYGLLKSDRYQFDNPFSPVSDMDEWERNNPPELYRP